jgi:hypothetical protein
MPGTVDPPQLPLGNACIVSATYSAVTVTARADPRP